MLKKLTIASFGKDLKQVGLCYTVGENVQWDDTLENQFGGFLKS